MNVRHDAVRVLKKFPGNIGLLALMAVVCTSLPVFADDTAYILQYEVRFGRQQMTSNMYLALQPRSSFERFDQQQSIEATRLSTFRDQSPRLPLFETENESDGSKSDSECGGFCVLFGLAVIGGSIYALQDEGELEECLVGGLITGYC